MNVSLAHLQDYLDSQYIISHMGTHIFLKTTLPSMYIVTNKVLGTYSMT